MSPSSRQRVGMALVDYLAWLTLLHKDRGSIFLQNIWETPVGLQSDTLQKKVLIWKISVYNKKRVVNIFLYVT
jgi:hypothetical protein